MVMSEGLLGQGYWKGVKEKQDQYAAPAGALGLVTSSEWHRSAQNRSLPGSLRSTSWLDGLRGFAALLVRISSFDHVIY